MAENEEPVYESYDSSKADQPSEQKGGGGGVGAIIAIILILIIVAGLGYYFLTKKPAVESAQALELLPAKCAMLVHIDLARFEDQKAKEEMTKKLKESSQFKELTEKLEKEKGIDIEKDILSWVGEQAYISFLEVPSPPSSPGKKRDTSNDHFVLIMTVKDQKTAEQKLKQIGPKFKEEKYEGITIWNPEKPETPCIAFIKGFLVMANTLDDMKKCIDTSNKKNPNLKENKDLSLVTSHLPQNSMFTFYVDSQAFIEEGQKQKGQPASNPEEEKIKKAIRGFGFGIALKDGDFIGQGFLGLDKASDSALIKAIYETKPTMGSPSSVKIFPKDTAIFAALDAKMIYNIVMKFIATLPNEGKDMEENKKKMKEETGVDLDKDIIDNLTGELAYSMDFQGILKSVMSRGKEPPAIIISLTLKDKAKMQEVLNKILEKAPEKLEKEDRGGVVIYKAPNDTANFCIYENFLLFGSGQGSDTMKAIIDNKMDEAKSLASDPIYKKMQGKLGPNTFSVSILKFEKVLPTIKNLMGLAAMGSQDPKQIENASKAIEEMEKFDSIWSFSEIVNDGFKFEFIMVKKQQ